MECGKPVCSILFDVQIAFDSVLHSSLVEKMQTFGLNTYQYQLRWICDYLIEREQCVVLNGTTSRLQHVHFCMEYPRVSSRPILVYFIPQ